MTGTITNVNTFIKESFFIFVVDIRAVFPMMLYMITKHHLMNIASDELAIRAGHDLQGNVTFFDGIASMSLLIARVTDSRYDEVYADLQNLSLQKHKEL
jgi:hypothetical protein